jgi:hypothetical protein
VIAAAWLACAAPDGDAVATDDTDLPVDPPPDTADSNAPPTDAGTLPTGSHVFPDVIGHLVVVLGTAPGENAGTDDEALTLCLTATDCFPLELAGVDDFRPGEADTYHFEGLSLPRVDVDRVQLLWGTGGDRWEPDCLEVHFDGEPVHCEDRMEGLFFGDGVGELVDWTDPDGLHQGCDACEDDLVTEGPVLGWGEEGTLPIWVRTDGSRRVGLRVSSTGVIEEGEEVAVAWPDPDDDYGTVLRAESLLPGHSVVWQLEIDGVPWGVPRGTVTPPTPGAPVSFDLAFGSSAVEDKQGVFSAVLAAGSDAFLFLGDSQEVAAPELPALRAGWRWAHGNEDRAEMLASIPVASVWDDLDYLGMGSDRSTPGAADALRAFGEYWPNPAPVSTEGVYFRAEWGDVALFAIDVRSDRELGSILGDDQRAWLVDAMTSSDATFKLLASPSPFDLRADDGWSSFVAEREGLFGDLAGVEGVVLLTGGQLRSELRWIPDPGIGYDLPEWSSGPLLSWPLGLCAWPPPGLVSACYADGPSFVRLDIDTTAVPPRIVAEIRDLDGNIVATDEVEVDQLSP